MKKAFHVKVHVRLKKGVLDPQGLTVKQALESMGYRDVQEVRVGKFIEIDFDGKPKDIVVKEVKEMGERLLINPIIEEFYYEIESR
ncbi:MAG: phosphoribosylformylglycinamidine synthase subunit PurS [Candidatus Omnitrophica bacterium]|nr:phosphoribosylformylglycinamidine synthase subunit PurS [Candidatus Omnitrophota bacterium]